MNEQELYVRRVKPWLTQVSAAYPPFWWRKTHGSRFARNLPDILFMCPDAHGAVELKNPDGPQPPTPMQRRELEQISLAGGWTLVSHDEVEVRRFFARILKQCARWSHPVLTEPFLATEEVRLSAGGAPYTVAGTPRR